LQVEANELVDREELGAVDALLIMLECLDEVCCPRLRAFLVDLVECMLQSLLSLFREHLKRGVDCLCYFINVIWIDFQNARQIL